MRVLFDSQIFCAQHFGGISRYFAALGREFYAAPGVTPRVVAPVHINAHLSQLPADMVVGRELPSLRKAWPVAYLASAVLGVIPRARFKPDLVHQTFYYQARSNRKLPTVTTVHDMIHEKYPEGLSGSKALARWKKARVLDADHVICVSQNTKADVLDLYGISEQKISVVYHGYDPLRAQDDVSASLYRRQLFGADDPYLLFVGVRVGYKNFDGLLNAFGRSNLLKNNFRLLCFGGGPFTALELQKLELNGLTKLVSQIQGSDVQLANAYRHATMMVYPSRYEGFGLPPVEAMSLSCPVACSNAGSLPEVVESAAALFDPDNEEQIRDVIEGLAESSSERHRLAELGRRRCQSFSWNKCATETLAVYKSIAP